MYHFFKKQRKLFLGILIGLIIGGGGFVFADTAAKVSAVIANHVSFQFDGKNVPIPAEYTVLNYQGRIYVPARFVAENLGAEVTWDAVTNRILFESPKLECPEPPVQEPGDQEDPKKPDPSDKDRDDEDKDVSKRYSKLPMSAVKDKIWVYVSGITVDKDDKVTWIYVEVENKGSANVQLDQRATTILTDGKTYYQKDVRAVYDTDPHWYNDIREDEKVSGFIKMPLPEKGEKWGDMTLTLKVRKNDGSGDVLEFDFDIAGE